MKRVLFAAAGLIWLAAGCAASNTAFVYKPSPPVAGGKTIPLKLAVLPFADGTGTYTVLGSVLTPGNCTHNLAKVGIKGRIDALTPDLWAKAFAEDLAASGAWRSVRFVYGMQDLSDEDYYIEGTLLRADSGLLHVKGPNRFALALEARRKSDGGPVWKKEVAREWTIRDGLFAGCGFPEQCRTDRAHADVNREMREMFEEARADLVRALAPLAGNREAAPPLPPETGTDGTVAEPSPDSVDDTIRNILKGK